jgi:hypothetical protein
VGPTFIPTTPAPSLSLLFSLLQSYIPCSGSTGFARTGPPALPPSLPRAPPASSRPPRMRLTRAGVATGEEELTRWRLLCGGISSPAPMTPPPGAPPPARRAAPPPVRRGAPPPARPGRSGEAVRSIRSGEAARSGRSDEAVKLELGRRVRPWPWPERGRGGGGVFFTGSGGSVPTRPPAVAPEQGRGARPPRFLRG